MRTAGTSMFGREEILNKYQGVKVREKGHVIWQTYLLTFSHASQLSKALNQNSAYP